MKNLEHKSQMLSKLSNFVKKKTPKEMQDYMSKFKGTSMEKPEDEDEKMTKLKKKPSSLSKTC